MRIRHAAALLGMGILAGCGSDQGEGESSSLSRISGIDTSRLATSFAITEVAVFQPLKISIAKEGHAVTAAERTTPLLANRDAVLRVYVKQTAPRKSTKWPVKAVVEISDATGHPRGELSDTKWLQTESIEATQDSTFNVQIPGENLPIGAKLRVSLVDLDPTTGPIPAGIANAARYPANGDDVSMDIVRPAEKLKIVLVPVKYDPEGQGLMPDISEQQIEHYRQIFETMYPLSKLDLTVRSEPIVWTTPFSIGGILRATVALRAQDNPPPETYYYGSFAPRATFAEYCPSGCVTGLSGLPGPDGVAGRASVGVGFTGTSSARTFAHEVGHAHGRRHTACTGGEAGADPAYPHQGGSIGVWGWDPRTNQLVDPATSKDVMSYCRPPFIGDWTYNKLLERLTHVNQAALNPPPAPPVRANYRLVDVDGKGLITLGEHITLNGPPGGEPHEVRYQDKAGREIGVSTAYMIPYDHLEGGYMFVPEEVPFERIDVPGIGRSL